MGTLKRYTTWRLGAHDVIIYAEVIHMYVTIGNVFNMFTNTNCNNMSCKQPSQMLLYMFTDNNYNIVSLLILIFFISHVNSQTLISWPSSLIVWDICHSILFTCFHSYDSDNGCNNRQVWSGRPRRWCVQCMYDILWKTVKNSHNVSCVVHCSYTHKTFRYI